MKPAVLLALARRFTPAAVTVLTPTDIQHSGARHGRWS
jgi:hypothetical protein